MADESTADDGALHHLFQTIPPERVQKTLRLLLVLSRVRVITDDIRAKAQALADDPDWPLGDHPIVRRILEA